MKHILTKCPICSARFYHEVHDDPVSTVVCPYCRHRYTDRVDLGGIKEVDYHWELYHGLYPPVEDDFGSKKQLKINGLLQIIAVPCLLVPLFLILLSGPGSEMTWEDYYVVVGVVFAGLIFLTFTCAGIISSVKSHSFAISLTGAIFMILSSLLVIALLNMGVYTGSFVDGLCYATLIPIAISSLSLSIIIRNKKAFSTGY